MEKITRKKLTMENDINNDKDVVNPLDRESVREFLDGKLKEVIYNLRYDIAPSLLRRQNEDEDDY